MLFFVKIGKFGLPYFHEFATDSCETSHILELYAQRPGL